MSTVKNLGRILLEHKIWLDTRAVEGRQLDLRDSDLRYVDLTNTDLRHASLQGADLGGVNLRNVDFRHSDLTGTNLQYSNLCDANLQHTNLQGANLRGANLDFSCYPLDYHASNPIVDEKLPQMLCAFICSMQCEDEETKEIQNKIRSYAEKSHRADEILKLNKESK